MANTPTVYVLCDANCKWEGMTKEQILTAIAQAVETGTISDIDTGFVQTIKTINGHPLKFFVGEQSEYEALTAEDKQDLFAIITNDTNKEGIINAITALTTEVNEVHNGLLDGSFIVKNAENAEIVKALSSPIKTCEKNIAYGDDTIPLEFERGKTYAVCIEDISISTHTYRTVIVTIPKDGYSLVESSAAYIPMTISEVYKHYPAFLRLVVGGWTMYYIVDGEEQLAVGSYKFTYHEIATLV